MEVSRADVAVFRNGLDFARLLGKGRYTRVVVYSHGDPWQLMSTINDRGTHVRDYTLAKSLGEAGVREALFLGCNSQELAERVARILEGHVRIGGIAQEREDEIKPGLKTMVILNMIIWGYGGRK
jgi:hypothetical protein